MGTWVIIAWVGSKGKRFLKMPDLPDFWACDWRDIARAAIVAGLFGRASNAAVLPILGHFITNLSHGHSFFGLKSLMP